ncbi:MAG: CoA-binding protein [Trueperaceae bacterium]|nr:CoA-binding protein [Trueperaceae bacterium]
MSILSNLDDVKRVLRQNKTIAVLGAHTKEAKAAYYVPKYMLGAGYEIYPVNPAYAGQDLFGKRVLEKLEHLSTPIDIVNVFRRSEALPEHLDDILAMRPLPKYVWFQLGIINNDVAKKLSDAGIDVIQDRCMLADHQYLL